MKPTLILILAFLPGMLSAQFHNRFSIGPRIGLNFASVDRENTSSTTGLALGLTSTYSLNEATGLTIDALYSAEGFKENGVETDLAFLRVPILYDVFFGKLGENLRPKIYLGVAPGFLLKAETNNRDVESQYKNFVIDLAAGAGFNYRLASRVWLNTDARLGLGLTSFKENVDDYNNLTIQISLGVAYGL